jgi:coenzyme F420-reducing hydrogenase beta subunit
MSEYQTGYDYRRYLKLLAEAVDENKRLALIGVLIQEHARERLEVQRVSDQVAMTTATVAQILGPPGLRDHFEHG